MAGNRCLNLRGLALVADLALFICFPGSSRQIPGSKTKGAGVINFLEDQRSPFQTPGVGAYIQMAIRVIKQDDLIIRDGERANTPKAGQVVRYSKDTGFKAQGPGSPFGPIRGAAPAGSRRALQLETMGIDSIQFSWRWRRERSRVGVRLPNIFLGFFTLFC